jgi:type IX secretion system PorP/SprF family membrane protein
MKTRKIILLIFAIVQLIYVDTFAQQDPQYTQYMYNMNVVNPAYAGSKEAFSLGFLYRKQWVSLDGAPSTLTLSGHTPLKKNIGIGLSLISDKIGPVDETNAYADISYTVNLNETHKLAFGLKTGATFHKVDFSKIYPTLVHNDDVFGQPNPSTTDLNFGFGAFYYTNNYYVSLSIPNFLKSNYLDYNGVSYGSEVSHYFLTGGYVFQLNPNLKFKPSFLVKTAFGAPTSYDVSANFLLQEKLELGATYRREDSFGAMVNFMVTPQFRVGYAYDHIMSDLNFTTPSSHEIILLYDFNLSKKVPQSSRFF